jgi:hypothetical protein
VHVVAAFGIKNMIYSLLTEMMLVTLLPHNDKLTWLLSFMGNPVPMIVA